jgi:hypothetical protein
MSKIEELIASFEKFLKEKLSALNQNTNLLDEAFSKRTKFRNLITDLRVLDQSGGIIKDEPALFKQLIDFETKINPKKAYSSSFRRLKMIFSR